jgi:DNA helicase-2/ATP-dependent DNA helicase PcrA
MNFDNNLNPEQLKAVTFNGGPLLILAGAGSGKTRVLTHRVAYFMSELGIGGNEILLLTFTNKAAEEMMKRVKILTKDAVATQKSNVEGGTFHSFCARLLRNYSSIINSSNKYVIFDEGDQLDTIKQSMERLGVDVKTVKPGAVLGTISAAKNELVGPSEYAGFAKGNWQSTVAKIYMVYQQLLKKYNAFDFDDLLMETVRVLKSNRELLTTLRSRYKYILVDEYQDTNKAQYEITRLLSLEHQNLTVVGDAAQAIYSWRGANYKNLMLLKQDFANLTIVNLEQNYRSTKTILTAANKVISKNKNHPILNLWTNNSEGERINIIEAESEIEESAYVISKIKEEMQLTNKNFGDFAVLYRTNAQSRILEESFLHSGIPYSLVGGVRFYERKEIKDILAYLRLALNPEDEIAKKRAEKNGKTRLNNLLKELPMDTLSTIEALDKAMRATGYLDLFDENNEEDASRLENIKELRSVAMQHPNLADFLEIITLTEKEAKRKLSEASNSYDGAVTLMTIHAAKGLEFKNVYVMMHYYF